MDKKLSLPVFQVSQPIGPFLLGVASAQQLLSICKFDFRRIHERGGRKEFLGIQRELKETRTRAIAEYIRTVDAVFPTSIVLSIDERCARTHTVDGVQHLELFEYIDEVDSRLNIPFDSIATIIDGQHRLKSFEGITDVEFDLPVSFFIGIDDAIEATIFSTVNLAQTKVNKSLVYDLFSLDRNRSPEKTAHEIAVALDQLDESPLKGRIKRLGTATDGRFGETLSQATVVKGILPYISRDPMGDRDIGKRFGFWPEGDAKTFEARPFYEFFRSNHDEMILANVISYFQAAAERWPAAWASTGQGSVLSRTNGFNALMRFFRPAYLSVTTQPKLVSKNDFMSIFLRSSLRDDEINAREFPAGSTGASRLYNTLMDSTGLR